LSQLIESIAKKILYTQMTVFFFCLCKQKLVVSFSQWLPNAASFMRPDKLLLGKDKALRLTFAKDSRKGSFMVKRIAFLPTLPATPEKSR
jgi:hypothetical protein